MCVVQGCCLLHGVLLFCIVFLLSTRFYLTFCAKSARTPESSQQASMALVKISNPGSKVVTNDVSAMPRPTISLAPTSNAFIPLHLIFESGGSISNELISKTRVTSVPAAALIRSDQTFSGRLKARRWRARSEDITKGREGGGRGEMGKGRGEDLEKGDKKSRMLFFFWVTK